MMPEDTSWVTTLRALERRLIELLDKLRDQSTVSRHTRMTWHARKDACVRLALEMGYRSPEVFAGWVEGISPVIDAASSDSYDSMRRLFEQKKGMFWGFVPTKNVAHPQRRSSPTAAELPQ